MRIYVASSWKNNSHPAIVNHLRNIGHEVYDFKNPPNKAGFGWEEIDLKFETGGYVDYYKYIEGLETPRAEEGFKSDFDAMQWAEVFILVLPCGRSAHLEAGWAIGQGKPTAILFTQNEPPDLMYKMADIITNTSTGLLNWLKAIE